MSFIIYQPMKMEQKECSETSAYKIQTRWNCPKENVERTEQGESFKSRISETLLNFTIVLLNMVQSVN